MSPISERHPLREWFSGLVESSFNVEIGICDPTLVAYLTELLTEFVHVERIDCLQDGSGRRLEDVAEMIREAELGGSPSTASRHRLAIHRHIGDFTLFWTGVYPERLQRMRRRHDRDALLGYLEQGKRSYAIASDLSPADAKPPATVLRRLSDHFEDCVYGLGLVRRSWEQSQPAVFDRVNKAWLQ